MWSVITTVLGPLINFLDLCAEICLDVTLNLGPKKSRSNAFWHLYLLQGEIEIFSIYYHILRSDGRSGSMHFDDRILPAISFSWLRVEVNLDLTRYPSPQKFKSYILLRLKFAQRNLKSVKFCSFHCRISWFGASDPIFPNDRTLPRSSYFCRTIVENGADFFNFSKQDWSVCFHEEFWKYIAGRNCWTCALSRSDRLARFLPDSVERPAPLFEEIAAGSGYGASISAKFLIALADVLDLPLAILCRRIFAEGTWPAQRRLHNLVSLYVERFAYDPSKCRGIHLTSILSKVVGRVISLSLALYLKAVGFGISQ